MAMMHMTFYWGYDATILFSWWKTDDALDFFVAVTIIFFSCLLSAWLKLRSQESMDAKRDDVVLLSPTPLSCYGSNIYPTGQTPALLSSRQSSALSLGWCSCYSETPNGTKPLSLLCAGAVPFTQQQEGEENAPAAKDSTDRSCPEDAHHSGSRIEVHETATARDVLKRTLESSPSGFDGPSTNRSLGNPDKLLKTEHARKAGRRQKGDNPNVFLVALEQQPEGGRSDDLPEPCRCGHPRLPPGLAVQLPQSIAQEAELSATYPRYIWNMVGRPREYGSASGQPSEGGREPKPVALGQLRRALAVWMYACVIGTIDWSLILICMTFNAGIFCAVIAGVATGRALTGAYLGRRTFPAPSSREFLCCHDHA